VSLFRKITSAVVAWLWPPARRASLNRRRAALILRYAELKRRHLPREHVLQELQRLTVLDLRR
jgi:hypothetical protein